MKPLVKHLIPIIIVCLFSCNQGEKNTSAPAGKTSADSIVAYTSCRIQLSHNIEAPAANEKVNFQLKPVAQPGNTTARLETVHEKKIHLIVVNEDLSYFEHLHLDKDSAGIFNITTSFPAGGNYILMADYKAEGIPTAVDTFHITIQGKPQAAATYTAPQLTTDVDGYQVQLLTKKVYPLSQSQLIMKIKKDGKEILPGDLQPYLGETSHLIAINTVTKEYVHAYAMSDQMSYWYMLTFPRAGFYKLWVQFKTNEVVHTAAFVVEAVNTK